MKKIEKILAVLIIISLAYKFFNGIGSSIALILFMTLLTVVYLFFSFALFNDIALKKVFIKDSYSNTTGGKIFLSIFTGIILSISILGILFKLQSYSGADILLLFGLLTTIILTLLTLYKNYKTEGEFYYRILIRVSIIAIMITSLLKIPEDKIMKLNFPDYPEYIDAVIKLHENPDSDSLRIRVKIEKEKMILSQEKEYSMEE